MKHALAAAAALLLAPQLAHADWRAYGVTYEAVTAPQGELDVETWSTYAREGEVDGGPASRGIREMVELEYGVTDRWDAALYNMVDMTSGDGENGYAGFKVETRYRLSDRGEWFVDPVLYAEFGQYFVGDKKQGYELKLILARDLGKLNLAVNGAVEEERTTDPKWNTEGEYAAGASYEVTPAIKVGGETFGKTEKADTGGLENRTWVGPAVSWATEGHGTLHGLWVTLAGGAGVTAEADPFYGRAVVGLQF